MQRSGVQALRWSLQRRTAASSAKRRAQAPAVANLLQELHSSPSRSSLKRSITEVLQTLEAAGARPADYASAITALASSKQWPQAMHMLKLLRDTGKDAFLPESAMLSSFDKGDLWLTALAYLDGTKVEGGETRLTTVGYRAAVRVYMQAGRTQEAERCFEELLKQGPPKSLSGFNAAMSACQRLHRWEAAVQYFDDMQASYVNPDMISWNTLISNCGSALEWRWSVQLLHEMKWNWLKPDAASFGAVLGAMPAANSWAAVFNVLKSMRQEEVVPSSHGYTSAIQACIDASSMSNEEPWAAWAVFDDAISKGVALGKGGYGKLLSAAATWKRWEKVVWLLRRMKANRAGFQLPAESKNLAAEVCLEASAWRAAMDIVQLSPMDGDGYNVLLRAAAGLQKWALALKAFSEMQRKGHLPTAAACEQLVELAGQASSWQEAVQVVALMQTAEDELAPSTRVYNAALDACQRSQQGASALALLSDMEKQTVKTDTYTYTSAIAALQSLADWETGLHLLDQMQRQQLEVGTTTWGALLNIRCKAAPVDYILKLLHASRISLQSRAESQKLSRLGKRLLREAHRQRICADSTAYIETMQASQEEKS